MRTNKVFVLTLWAALALVWAVSGDRFLDLVFAMPDIGVVDDLIISAVLRAEDARALLDPPDLFGQLRHLLHRLTGLG